MTDLQTQLLKLIKEREYVSFAEIMDQFPKHAGDRGISLPGYPNTIYWLGLSEELVDALVDLMSTKQIYVHPASAMTYMIDGRVPKLPVAKSVRHYKNPHWLPVTLDIRPNAAAGKS